MRDEQAEAQLREDYREMRRIGKLLVFLFTGEFFVCGKNSGGVIILRTLYIALVLSFAAWLLLSCCPSLVSGKPDWLVWFGAFAAGAYTALYTRFSSQWTYLASVYNQIKETECSLPNESGAEDQWRAFREWKISFMEDAVLLHLAGKHVYSVLIVGWLSADPKLFDMYASDDLRQLANVVQAMKLGKEDDFGDKWKKLKRQVDERNAFRESWARRERDGTASMAMQPGARSGGSTPPDVTAHG